MKYLDHQFGTIIIRYLLLVFISWSCTPAKTEKETITTSEIELRYDDNLYFKKISSSNGLPSTEILNTFHDSQGYSWISTGKGVAKYDGYDLEIYADLPEENIYLSGASQFFEDTNRKLWLLSGNGYLQWFDGTSNQFVPKKTHLENGWSIEKGHGFSKDSMGGFWFSAYGGLQYFNPVEDSVYLYPISKIRDPSWQHKEKVHLECIQDDGLGNLWLGSRKFGLIKFNKTEKSYDFYRDKPGYIGHLLDEWITAIAPAKQGKLWIVDHYSGLYLLNPETGELDKKIALEKHLGLKKTINIWDIKVEDNRIWIGTAENGLILYNAETDVIEKHYVFDELNPQSISSNAIKSVNRDTQGNLWLASEKVNIGSASFYEFRTVHIPKTAKKENPIHELATSSDGKLIISTLEGALLYDAAKENFSPYKSFSPFKQTYGLLASEDGKFWVGDENNLSLYNPKTDKILKQYSKNIPVSEGNQFRTAMRILEDSQGIIWTIDHWARLKHVNPKTDEIENVFELAQDKETERFIEITSIADDPENRQIIVASSLGLARVSYDTYEVKWISLNYGSKDFSKAKATFIYRDLENRFWTILNGTVFELETSNYTIKPLRGLKSFQAKSFKWLLEAPKGNMWISTFDGIINFTKGTENYTFYPTNNISEGTFNKPSPQAHVGDKIFFAGQNGLTIIEPSKLYPDNQPPITLVKSVTYTVKKKNGIKEEFIQYLEGNKSIDLDYFQQDLKFDYLGIHLKNSNLIKYQYRLNGYDADWVNAGNNRQAVYTNLSPRKYNFVVRAANSDGVWSESTFPIFIQISPPLWKTWWAYLFYILLFGVLLYGWNRYAVFQKIQKYKAIEMMRSKISADLHDDVGSILSGLSMKSELMSFSAEASQQKELTAISKMSRDAMEHMRDTVWAIDSRKDKYENLIDRMRAYAESNLSLKNFSYEFTTNNLEGQSFINPELRQNLYLIFKEAITNILKYSDGTNVNIQLRKDGKGLKMYIIDNGSQKELLKTDGLGMSNMKLRADKLGGTFNAFYDNGFNLEVHIPLQ